MKRINVISSVALALAAAAIPGAALASQTPSEKPFTVCQTDKAIPDGNYEVNNNNFVRQPECLTGSTGTLAFRVSHSGASSTGPKSDSFPDIFAGCSWGRCSPGSPLPGKLSAVGNLETTFVGDETASGIWGAGYDMFLDQRPIHDGQAQIESMIWLNSNNAYDPAGHGWPLVSIDGTKWWAMTWETGHGKKHWRYVQFRRVTPATSVRNLPLGPFFTYLEREGWVTPDWYLLNVEGGFEIWNGGTGLAVKQFSVRPRPRPKVPVAKPGPNATGRSAKSRI